MLQAYLTMEKGRGSFHDLGFGLARLMGKIAEVSAGGTWLASETGKGNLFRCYLPGDA
jgi:hypothetical protein